METYNGSIKTLKDALLVIEATRLGKLPKITKRLSESERRKIKSGSVFVWNENESGMRRWTDGRSWSASRVSNSFLIYKEMEGRREDDNNSIQAYSFKANGLTKKSFSVVNKKNEKFHLICYINILTDNLKHPCMDHKLSGIKLSVSIYPENLINESEMIEPDDNLMMPENSKKANNGHNHSYSQGNGKTHSSLSHTPLPTPRLQPKMSMPNLSSGGYSSRDDPRSMQTPKLHKKATISNLKYREQPSYSQSDYRTRELEKNRSRILLPPINTPKYSERNMEDGKILNMMDRLF